MRESVADALRGVLKLGSKIPQLAFA